MLRACGGFAVGGDVDSDKIDGALLVAYDVVEYRWACVTRQYLGNDHVLVLCVGWPCGLRLPILSALKFGLLRKILWSGRELDSALLPAFALCLLFTHNMQCLNPHAEHFILLNWVLLRYTGHNFYSKLEEIGIRALLPLAGFWLF